MNTMTRLPVSPVAMMSNDGSLIVGFILIPTLQPVDIRDVEGSG